MKKKTLALIFIYSSSNFSTFFKIFVCNFTIDFMSFKRRIGKYKKKNYIIKKLIIKIDNKTFNIDLTAIQIL